MQNNQPQPIPSPEGRKTIKERWTDFFRRLLVFDRRMHALAPEIFLILLIVIGIFFRFSWTNWSEGTNLHPDEYGLTNTLSQLSFPRSIEDYFNTRLSPISPYERYGVDGNPASPGPDNGFVWGQWPLILIRGAAEGLTDLQESIVPWLSGIGFNPCLSPGKEGAAPVCKPPEILNYASFDQIRLLGRTLSALADTITLLACFAIGMRLYSRRVALLGTALSALAVLQIQQSHFMTVDNYAALFAILAMYCAVRVAQKGGWGWYALFGCFYAMTLASKVNMAPMGVVIAVAAWMGNRDRWKRTDLSLPARFAPAVGGMTIAVLTTMLVFRVTQPMSFRAPTGDTTFFTVTLNTDWLERMEYAQQVSSGVGLGGYPPAMQWTARAPVIFPWVNMVLWGMGLPLGLAGWIGLLWATYRIYKGEEWKTHLLPVLFALGMFLFLGTRWVMTVRYFLALYPFFCLLAAWALNEFWVWACRKRRWWKALAGSVVAVVVLGTLAWAWGFTSIYRSENTRLQASRWIYQNFPSAFSLNLLLPTGGEYREPVPFYSTQEIGTESIRFSIFPQQDGTLESISLGFVTDTSGGADSVLHIELFTEPAGAEPLAVADLTIPPTGSDPRGQSVTGSLLPVEIKKGKQYILVATAARGGPFKVQGATYGFENWDEPMPQGLDGRNPDLLYSPFQVEMEWPDVEDKRTMLLESLAKADYLVVQSQRRIWSNSRLPAAFPMTMEYYRALFDGRLGFDLVTQFQSPITIGPLQVSDLGGTAAWGRAPELPVFNDNPLSAEEAFSVYDHAPVWIFQKRVDFRNEEVQAVLNAVDLATVVQQDPQEAAAFPNALMLPADRLAEQRAGGTWSEMFSYDRLWNQYPALAAILWWLWALITGWAAMPLVSLAFRGLPDEGYSLTKIAGWLLVAWAVWLLGCFRVPFVWTTIAAVWLLFVAVSGVVVWRTRTRWAEKIKTYWKTWLIMEIVFLAFFLFDLLLRLGYSDLWHLWTGGEKPMDFSYLNAVLRSTSFPPYDPWFAGGYLNYYYFGFVLVAIPIKLLATVPSIAYNLVVPMLYGTVGVSAYGVAWNLAEGLRRKGSLRISPVVAGIGAAVMLAVLGNLGEVRMLWDALTAASALPLPHGLVFGLGDLLHAVGGLGRMILGQASMPYGSNEWYWKATRAILVPTGPNGALVEDGSITEFPFFTFLLADLHAHLIAMPLILLSLAGPVAMVISPQRLQSWKNALPTVALTALAVGSLWPTNAWNYPFSLAVAIIGLLLAGWRMLSQSTGLLDGRGWIRILILCGLLAGLTVWLFQPYYQWYGAGYNAVEKWNGAKTPWESYLVIHGLFLFIIFTYLVWQTREWMATTPIADWKGKKELGTVLLLIVSAIAAGLVILAIFGYQVLVLAIPLIIWAILLGLRRNLEDEHRVVFGLIAISLAITCVVEVVVLAGDIGRMNTVFKFYLQAWLFFAIAAGVALGWLAGEIGKWRTGFRYVWLGGLGLLVVGGLFYTVEASYSRMIDRTGDAAPRTLDGMAFMPYTTYEFGDDYGMGTYDLRETYDAIRWMEENIQGSPVIVQSPWPHYRGGLPYTMYTGLPNVLGWNWHQRQQRGAVADAWVWDRDRGIEDFYKTTDLAKARAFLHQYDVRYIVLSQLERNYYPGEGLDKFESMLQNGELEVVFSESRTAIYEVVDLKT